MWLEGWQQVQAWVGVGLKQCFQDLVPVLILVRPMFWFHFHVQIQWHTNSVSILPTNILGWHWLVQKRSHAHSLNKAWPGERGTLIGQASHVLIDSVGGGTNSRRSLWIESGGEKVLRRNWGCLTHLIMRENDIDSQGTLAAIHCNAPCGPVSLYPPIPPRRQV